RANEYRPGWEEPSFRSEATLEGYLKLPKRSPGRFWIKVYDRLGNAVFSDQQASLLDPSQPYPIPIDLLSIEGKIRIGDEPVTGRLFFGGRNGTVSVEMTSNTEGHFGGPLPRAGHWRVDIEGAEPSLKTAASVEIKPKNGHAAVEIVLPNTRVYGRVVDPSGMPASTAEVTLSSEVSTLFATTNEKGEFEFRAFPKGITELSARRVTEGRHEVSDIYSFEAPADSPHGPVVLTLRRTRSVRGRVLGVTGPSIGATVSAWPTQGGDGVISRVRSGLDGRFEFTVPEGTTAVRGVLSPPGGALKTFEAQLSNEAELLLQEEPSGGDVAVTFGKGEPAEGKVLAVIQDEVGIPIGELVDWAEAHGAHIVLKPGSRIQIPQVAPGNYTVCLGVAAIVASSEVEAWRKRSSCVSGYLPPGASLKLHFPE
ncbi:MAG: carboxypeptidase-like regulatory domain-containing protein, partial [Thermoanaerobaculia bacterium]